MNQGKSIPSSATPPGYLKRFGARVLDDPRHDPYQPPGKYAEPTHCPSCGAVYERGRWLRAAKVPGSRSATCPACRRIDDKLPAGRLSLAGPYVALHRAELVQIARSQERKERTEHVLHRIMNIDERGDEIEITTTDVHLPRRIGESIKRAHDGELTIDFGKDAYDIRVHWQR